MNILITFAIQEEMVSVSLPGCLTRNILTGIGKANAALHTTKAIMDHRPDLVINVGTVGTLNHKVGDILVCTHFIDRDFERLDLPGIIYELRQTATPDSLPPILTQKGIKTGMVNTGDDFVTASEGFTGDVVDMEAYAEALVCREFNIPFVAVKCVTDIIGSNSVEIWESRLLHARRQLTTFFTQS